MKRKLVLGLVVAVFLFSIIAVQPVVADAHSTWEWDISPGSYAAVFGHRNEHTGNYGEIIVGDGNDITFYIMTESNYNKYVNDEPFVYQYSRLDSTGFVFTFRFPFTDTWYFVFCNKDAFLETQYVRFELYKDETAPTFTVNLNVGATYSGTKEIIVLANDARFEVYSIEILIDSVVKITRYTDSLSYNWNTKDYSNGQHSIIIRVKDNVNNMYTGGYLVNVDNYVAPTTGETAPSVTTEESISEGPEEENPEPGRPSGIGLEDLIRLGITFGLPLVIVAGVIYAIKRRGKREEVVEVVSEQVISKDAKVFVICPYCGAKTEQGIIKCKKCGADL